MSETKSLSFATMFCIANSSCPVSSFDSTSMAIVRSPWTAIPPRRRLPQRAGDAGRDEEAEAHGQEDADDHDGQEVRTALLAVAALSSAVFFASASLYATACRWPPAPPAPHSGPAVIDIRASARFRRRPGP